MGSNFHIPDKPNERSNHIIIEHIDEMLDILREQPTIKEVLPFFEKYKLKLRVYDVFYNLIHKYDPEV
ncbi:MAG: hypothetical protein ACKPKO_41745, partial [Candidatus Fonsibacter sp.]